MWASAEQTESLEGGVLSRQRVLSRVILLCSWSVLDSSPRPSFSPQPPFLPPLSSPTPSPPLLMCPLYFSLSLNLSSKLFFSPPFPFLWSPSPQPPTWRASAPSNKQTVTRLLLSRNNEIECTQIERSHFLQLSTYYRRREAGWRDGGEGGIIPIPLEAAEGRGMEVMVGSGFEVMGEGVGVDRGVETWGTLREEADGENVLHFECFSLCAPAALAGISVWSLASKSASRSPRRVPRNI